MEQTSNIEKHIPTYEEIMTMIHETQCITRVHTEEFDRRMKESDEKFERSLQKSREEFDRRMKESDEKFERSLQKSREDFDRRMREEEEARLKSREDFDRRMREEEEARLKSREDFDRRMREEEEARLKNCEDFDRRMKEEEQARLKHRDELERESKKTDKIIRKLSENFISQSGHIVEGLMEPCAMKIFQDYGFDLDKCWKNMEGRDKTTGKEMEVDLFLHDTTDSVAVEVKIHCTKKKIVHFLEQMRMFKQIFTEFAHNKIYVAVAAINFDKDAVAYAKENGVFLIHCRDDVFSLEPVDKEKLLTF